MSKYIKLVVIPAILIVVLLNVLVENPARDNINEYISKAIASGNHWVAHKEYKSLINSDFNNLEYHRGYISAHYEMSKHSRKSNGNGEGIVTYYENFSKDNDPNIADIGHYCLGYIKVNEKDYEAALRFYLKVQNENLEFLNNSIGYCYYKLGDHQKAKLYLSREIEAGKNLEGALYNYTKILLQERNVEELKSILDNPKYRSLLTPGVQRQFSFITNNFVLYFISILSSYKQSVIVEGIVAASLIGIIWFLFIKRLDIFEPEKFRYLFLTLFISIVVSEFAYLLYDFFGLGLGFRLEGSVLSELAYCVFGIGFIEELVKIIPVFIIFFSTKEINESTDFIIYASVSAIGFSFIENLGYFHEFGLKSIHGRALVCTLGHMIMSSIAVYGFMYSKYKKKSIVWFAVSFLGACVLHGLYDFFLVTSSWLNEFSIVSIALFIFSMGIYKRIVINALNNSEFFKPRDYTSYLRDNSFTLVAGLSYIMVVQYAIMAHKFGPAFANRRSAFNIFSLWLMAMIYVCFSWFALKKKSWVPLFKGNLSKKKNLSRKN